MDKQNAAHPYNGILLSHKKKKKWSGEFPGSWSGFQALTAGLDSIPGLGIKILQTLQYRFKKKTKKQDWSSDMHYNMDEPQEHQAEFL